MWKLVSLVPKSLWVALGATSLVLISVVSIYNKGYEKGKTETKIQYESKIKEQVALELSASLELIRAQTDKALALKENKDKIILEQSQHLEAIEAKSRSLEGKLNEVLSSPHSDTTGCSSLPDAEFRLYQEYYNQTL